MGLLSAMSASVSGMAAQGNALAAVSQNIANSSTTGYKQALTQFNDLVDQAGVSGDYTADGVTTTIRYNIAEHGNLTGTTRRPISRSREMVSFLLKMQAELFFMTRAGSFVPDQSGNLVNSAGYTLM